MHTLPKTTLGVPALRPLGLRMVTVALMVLSLWSCQKSEYANPTFLRIYLNQYNNEHNVYVIEALKRPEGETMIIAVKGNVPNKYERINQLIVYYIASNGELLGEYTSEVLPYGFPTNILYTKDGFDLFWSDYQNVYKYEFLMDGSYGFTAQSTKLQQTFNAQLKYGTAYCATQFDGGYLLYNFYTDATNMYNYLMEEHNGQLTFQGQYVSPHKELFPNINLTSPLVKYQDCFWLDAYMDKTYLCTPYQSKFALLAVGNNTPIYSDANFWLTSHIIYDSNAMAAVIVPQNLPDEEGLVYFTHKLPLNELNQHFNSLKHTLLQDLNKSKKTAVEQWGDHFFVAGTSRSGNVVVYVFDAQGNLIHQTVFGQLNLYEVASLEIHGDTNEVAIVGTTVVNNFYQRPFLLKVAISDLL